MTVFELREGLQDDLSRQEVCQSRNADSRRLCATFPGRNHQDSGQEIAGQVLREFEAVQ